MSAIRPIFNAAAALNPRGVLSREQEAFHRKRYEDTKGGLSDSNRAIMDARLQQKDASVVQPQSSAAAPVEKTRKKRSLLNNVQAGGGGVRVSTGSGYAGKTLGG